MATARTRRGVRRRDAEGAEQRRGEAAARRLDAKARADDCCDARRLWRAGRTAREAEAAVAVPRAGAEERARRSIALVVCVEALSFGKKNARARWGCLRARGASLLSLEYCEKRVLHEWLLTGACFVLSNDAASASCCRHRRCFFSPRTRASAHAAALALPPARAEEGTATAAGMGVAADA